MRDGRQARRYGEGYSLGQHLRVRAQMDEAYAGARAFVDLFEQRFAMCTAESGACKHQWGRVANVRSDQQCECTQPWSAIRLTQRQPTTHSLDAGGGMQVIGIVERPAELAGQPPAHRALPCTRHAHENDNDWIRFPAHSSLASRKIRAPQQGGGNSSQRAAHTSPLRYVASGMAICDVRLRIARAEARTRNHCREPLKWN